MQNPREPGFPGKIHWKKGWNCSIEAPLIIAYRKSCFLIRYKRARPDQPFQQMECLLFHAKMIFHNARLEGLCGHVRRTPL